jgi:hypothetical protein
MFVVGLELDPKEIERRPHVTLAVSGAARRRSCWTCTGAPALSS